MKSPGAALQRMKIATKEAHSFRSTNFELSQKPRCLLLSSPEPPIVQFASSDAQQKRESRSRESTLTSPTSLRQWGRPFLCLAYSHLSLA